MARIDRDDLADLIEDGPWSLSDGVRARPVDDVRTEYIRGQVEELSLTRHPANLAGPLEPGGHRHQLLWRVLRAADPLAWNLGAGG